MRIDTKRIVQVIKKNMPTILSITGAVGVVGTAAITAYETHKIDEIFAEDNLYIKKRTKKEKMEIATRIIPPVLTASATVAAILYSNKLNKKQQAQLMGAYLTLNQIHKAYKEKTAELYGEDSYDKIKEEIAKDSVEAVATDDGKTTFYDEYSNRTFRMTMLEFKDAVLEFSKQYILNGYACMNDLYSCLGLETTDLGAYIGWSELAGLDWYNYIWLDVELKPFVTEEGIECYVLSMPEATVDYQIF